MKQIKVGDEVYIKDEKDNKTYYKVASINEDGKVILYLLPRYKIDRLENIHLTGS